MSSIFIPTLTDLSNNDVLEIIDNVDKYATNQMKLAAQFSKAMLNLAKAKKSIGYGSFASPDDIRAEIDPSNTVVEDTDGNFNVLSTSNSDDDPISMFSGIK